MKLLLDECVDIRLRLSISGHEVFTVTYQRWNGLKNGQLLAEAVKAHFAALITTDRGVAFEQHIAGLPIAVVILHAASNDLQDLQLLVPDLLRALGQVRPGIVTHGRP